MAEALTERVFGGEPNLSWTERGVSLALGLGIAAAGVQPRPNALLSVWRSWAALIWPCAAQRAAARSRPPLWKAVRIVSLHTGARPSGSVGRRLRDQTSPGHRHADKSPNRCLPKCISRIALRR